MQLLFFILLLNLFAMIFLHIDTITHIEKKIDELSQKIQDNTNNRNENN